MNADYDSLLITLVISGAALVIALGLYRRHWRKRRREQRCRHIKPLPFTTGDPYVDDFYCLLLTDGTCRSGIIEHEQAKIQQ